MDSADITPVESDDSVGVETNSADASARAARDRTWADSGRVRYPGQDGEVVVERRPVVEEVVVRRRAVETGGVEDEPRPSATDRTVDSEPRSEPT
jgi:hypothetical protein